MKSSIRMLILAAGLCLAATSFAQKAAAPAPAVAASAVAAPMEKSASKAAVKANAAPTVAAAGGGDGKVWVNSKSKTYHCEGTKYYGKTKVGEYMSEADAKTKGNHADHGKACTK